MIVVVEGISAAGKTTWCRAHAQRYLVRESYPVDRKSQPETGLATAQYWSDWNAVRWGQALAMEAAEGIAVCDTDPLKIHYNWCSYRLGLVPRSQWEMQLGTTRQSLVEKRIGFADAYLVKRIDPAIARQQRDADTTRIRDRFDINVRFQPDLIRWYTALGNALGGRVHWGLPEAGLSLQGIMPNEGRYDVETFDRFIASLDAT